MSVPSLWHVASFYRFLSLSAERLAELPGELKAWMGARGIFGLVVLAEEGVNGTVAGGEAAIAELKGFLGERFGVELAFKDSTSPVAPFKRLSVDVRAEIVGMKRPDLVPTEGDFGHLSPRDWHAFLASDRPRLLVDTRNRYETKLGKFAGAVDPGLDHFSHWAAYVDEAGIAKETPVLIYCTGGIRCEKVALEMRARGFGEVYQLRDGILGYLAEYPNGFYEGECFVFDDRVALDANLQPTQRYGICPCCGLTGGRVSTCEWCGETYYACDEPSADWGPACSKTCRDRQRRHGLDERRKGPVNLVDE